MKTKDNKEVKAIPNDIVGAQVEPTTLEDNLKLDIDTSKAFMDEIIGNSLSNNLDLSEFEKFTSISNSRDQIYQLIDTMMRDSTVAAVIRIHADEVAEPSDNGHIMWCESDDPNISKYGNYLLNIMNVDKNIFKWAYNLVEYGDVYLKLYRESDHDDKLFNKDIIQKTYEARQQLNESINLDENVYLQSHSISDPYSGHIEMVDDPSTMFELTKCGKTYGYIEVPNADNDYNTLMGYTPEQSGSVPYMYNYKMKSNDVNVYQADDFVHACLEETYTRFPEKVNIFLNEADYAADKNAQAYTVRRGKSILYDAYKIWREKSLLEGAVLLNRVTRSSIIRLIQIEVGDMPKSQVGNTVKRIKQLIEEKSAYDVGTGMNNYSNPGPIVNNVYVATHDGKGNVSVSDFGGDADVKNIADLDYWNTRFYSSFGVPKAWLGWLDDSAGFNGGSALTVLSSVFAKQIKRVKNALIQAMTDALNLFFIQKGCRSYLNNFVLKMRVSPTQEEKDYRAEIDSKVNTISNMQSLFSGIEDRSNQLKILKVLIGQLSFGGDLTEILDNELALIEKEKEEEQAEKNETVSMEETSSESTELELPNLGESLQTKEHPAAVNEINILNLLEDQGADLPTPVELDDKLNFTDNTLDIDNNK